MEKKIPRIFVIGGSDSCAGAGIQADIKTVMSLGGYGMSALTALTAQNTAGVTAVLPVHSDFIRAQINAVLKDIGADAVKTGLMLDRSAVETVASTFRRHFVQHLVVDPVIAAGTGRTFMDDDTLSAICSHLLPLATVVTPNIAEAEKITGIKIAGKAQMREAARRISDYGPRWAVVKGGHLESEQCVNVAFNGRSFTEFKYKKIDTRDTHGTGCTFASAIATFLGSGLSAGESIKKAGDAVHCSIRGSHRLGKGTGPVSHAALARKYLCRRPKK